MSHPLWYTMHMIMNETSWTIRTRNLTSGHYSQQSFCDFTEGEARRHALADHPNSEVVGVWNWVDTITDEEYEALWL